MFFPCPPFIGGFYPRHCLFCRVANYYHFYTERSANQLGGVPDYAGEYHYHMDGLIVTYWDKLIALKNKYFA